MDCETVYIMLIVCYEYVISKLKLLLILTSFGESPEGNQNQYASLPEPFPLKRKRKKKKIKLIVLLLHKKMIPSNHLCDLIFRVNQCWRLQKQEKPVTRFVTSLSV